MAPLVTGTSVVDIADELFFSVPLLVSFQHGEAGLHINLSPPAHRSPGFGKTITPRGFPSLCGLLAILIKIFFPVIPSTNAVLQGVCTYGVSSGLTLTPLPYSWGFDDTNNGPFFRVFSVMASLVVGQATFLSPESLSHPPHKLRQRNDSSARKGYLGQLSGFPVDF